VYNFEVADNHNYFVGKQGVLVHNQCVRVGKVGSDSEMLNKGMHVHVNEIELSVRPDGKGGFSYGPANKAAREATSEEFRRAVTAFESELTNNVRFRENFTRTVTVARGRFAGHPRPKLNGLSGELNFLLKALGKRGK
jgi:hypothetical protein